MKNALRAASLSLVLFGAPAIAVADEAPSSKMSSEDRLVLVLAVVGSIASIAVGGFVHWKLLRGGGEEKK